MERKLRIMKYFRAMKISVLKIGGRRAFRIAVAPLVVATVLAAVLLASGRTSGGGTGAEPESSRHFLKNLADINTEISETLAGDSIRGLAESSAEIFTLTGSYLHDAPTGSYPEMFFKGIETLNMHAELLNDEDMDIEAARRISGVMSDITAWLFMEYYEGSDKGLYNIFYCPMAGHYWMQKDAETRNPYFGGNMLKCGSRVEEVRNILAPRGEDEPDLHEMEEPASEEADPFSVVDAPPSPLAQSIMKNMKCACCGQPLLTTSCGCAKNLRAKVKAKIEELEAQELEEKEMTTRLRDTFGARVVPEEPESGREEK